MIWGELLQELGIVEGEALSYRGEIEKLEMSKKRRELYVHCKHLFIQHRGFGGSESRWVLVPKIEGCTQCVKLDVTGGYFPKGGERIKAWTTLNMFTHTGEYFRLCKPGDPDNLVWNGSGFVLPS